MGASDRYLTAWTDFANAYLDGRWEEAAERAEAMRTAFPDHRHHLGYLLACVLSRMEDGAAALEVVRETVRAGAWWPSAVAADPDFDAIRDAEQFRSAFATMAEREAAARDEAWRTRPERVVVVPDGTPRFAVAALHMYGVGADETAGHWQEAARLGGLVVVPESTERDADGNPVWGLDELVDRDVHDAVNATIPAGLPLLLAGASQGARHALRLALGGAFTDCAGVAAVVGALDPDELSGPTAQVRGWLLAGEHDTFTRDRQRRLYSALRGRGVDCRYDEVPGLGHLYPDDFAARFEAVLPFLLG